MIFGHPNDKANKKNSSPCIFFLDKNEERSFKRELELFENDIQDEWELDDNEYLSKEELQDDREKKTLKNNDKYVSNQDDKRWLDVDTSKNGMYFILHQSSPQEMLISFHRSYAPDHITGIIYRPG